MSLSFLFFHFVFLPSPTALMPEPMLTTGGSKCMDWHKDVSFPIAFPAGLPSRDLVKHEECYILC